MSDALLPYYNRELEALRHLAAEFAAAHPKIAGRLRLSADAVDDPHVGRLLEGVAFLAARVHHRLDDESPELTDALLGVLYPHCLAPAPSCAIAQFHCQPDLEVPLRVPAGIALESEPVRGEPCGFRTAWPLTLWPIEVENVRLSGLPLAAPPNPRAAGAAAALRITLRCASPTMNFTQLGLDQLRLFLRAPPSVSLPLWDLISAHTVSVACADGVADPAPAILPATAIAPAGFAPDEGILPWPRRSFSGFRLLTEYFAFPEKFLFFDVTGLERKTLLAAGHQLDLFIYLDRALPELERLVGEGTLALGCTPVVNLFSQRCEPIPITGTETEYRVVPDVRRGGALEVWQVERVRESRPDGTSRAWQPFYRLADAAADGEWAASSFHAVRRPSPLGGTETWLAAFDPDFDPYRPADSVLSVDALCCNRDLPAQLPFGGGHPILRLVEGNAAIARINCLTAPTPTLRAPLRETGEWRLVSHLSLGHLSVVGGAAGASALKEVLRLYDLRDSAETRAAIDGLLSGIGATWRGAGAGGAGGRFLPRA